MEAREAIHKEDNTRLLWIVFRESHLTLAVYVPKLYLGHKYVKVVF